MAVDLAVALARAGHQVTVAAFKNGIHAARLADHEIPVQILGENMLDLGGFYALNNLIRAFNPDIIHSHLFRATFWARLALLNSSASLVTSIHGYESPHFHTIEKRMAGISDFTVFPSRHLQNWYCSAIKNIDEQKRSVIYPGTGISDLDVCDRKCRSGPILIGALSRLHNVKGLDVLLVACAILRKRGIDFKLVIAGEGSEKAFLGALVQRLSLQNRVHFVGSISSLKSFLESLDVFAAPSREEAFGINICEAMERGLPIVASAVGGIKEIVRRDFDGILFEVGDPLSAADALGKLCMNRECRMRCGANARKRILESFHREDAILKHYEIYARLTERKTRKIHFAVSSNEMGGGEKMAYTLAVALKSHGWEVTATCGGDPLLSALKMAGIKTDSASMKAGGIFFAVKLLKNLIQQGQSLISAHLNRASMICGMLKKIVPLKVIAHVHGLNKIAYYNGSDRLIAVSHAVEKHLAAQNADPEKVVTIANCIPEKVKRFVRRPGPPWIIAVTAKMHRNKGHYWALEAMEKHADFLPRFEVWLLGDGPERENLEKRFKSGKLKERIRFFGFQNDLDKYYPFIHYILLPSFGEGIPLSILEAMSRGIPSIATRIGGIPEIVDDDLNGILIEPCDEDGLSNALKRALENSVWQRLSEGAIGNFNRKNDFEKMIAGFETICSDFVNDCVQ